ncbi:MAG: efflux RND transporter periplasmic adaptor subunit [Gammaproteobacteria bacterium]|nr:efflux RND transporter periplasmic adaptor subunit [Gammaproteobacteria bacterium]
MKRKWLFAGGIVVLIIIVVAVALGTRGSDAVSVEAITVEPRSIKSSILASGKFAYKEQVELRSEVSGRIVALPVKEGERVEQGEVVLRINPKTYQANVAQQKARVAMQKNAIQEAKLKLKNLKRQWQRNTTLYKKGLVDANTYDQITNEYHLAQVAVQSAKKALLLAEAQLNYSQSQLAKTVIRSPLDGIITSLNVKEGESVIPGTTNIPGSTLMTIGDPSVLLAKVYVSEADIAHIAVGEKADVVSTAYPNATLSGKVAFVAPAAVTIPGQQGQGFEVKIRIDQTDKLDVRPGMTTRAEIYTRTTEDTLAVPVGAILFAEQHDKESKSLFSAAGAYVYVAENGEAERRDVTLGISSNTWQEVKSGLEKGDVVITGPYQVLHTMKPGESVKAEKNDASDQAPVAHSG